VEDVVPSRARIVLGLLAAALPLAGCGGLDNAAVAQGVSRNDLIAELAAQLDGSASLTYAATYQLAGGSTGNVTQAQDPPRTAYGYPGGQVLITGDATITCVKKTCTLTAPPVAAASPPAAVFTAARRTGLVPPSAVFALLTAAALDTDMTVDQHDTTIAGRHATCVKLADVDNAAASEFTTCITNDGVLGSFTGTLNGKAMDVAMTNYSDQASGDAFDLPPGAKTVDRR
jgi:hypothetical protein